MKMLKPGDRLQFDGKKTSWLVRATDDRYALATCSLFGQVYYTIIDENAGIRGAMNIIGGGLGIFTTSGPDPAIDKAMQMLRPARPWTEEELAAGSRPAADWSEGGWEISHRNRVALNITKVTHE